MKKSFLTLFGLVVALSASACSLNYRLQARHRPPAAISVETPAEAPPPVEVAQEAPQKVVREAGPIWSNDDAQGKCPVTCADLRWEGVWWTTVPSQMSVCECIDGGS